MRNMEKGKRNNENKVTKNITYLEAKKVLESQSTDLDFSKIVYSLSSKPESKSTGTQFSEKRFHYQSFFESHYTIN